MFNREDLDGLVKDFEPDNFESSTYYRVILQNLFFATLNKKIEERAFISDSFIENRNQGKHNIKTFMRHASDLAVSKEEFIKFVNQKIPKILIIVKILIQVKVFVKNVPKNIS